MQAGGTHDTACRGRPGKLSGAEVVWVWSVLECFALVSLWQDGWSSSKCSPGCPSVCHARVTLVGWLGLVWARAPGITEMVGQLGHLNPASNLLRVEGKCKLYCSPALQTQTEFLQLPYHLVEFCSWLFYIPVGFLNCSFFSMLQGIWGWYRLGAQYLLR